MKRLLYLIPVIFLLSGCAGLGVSSTKKVVTETTDPVTLAKTVTTTTEPTSAGGFFDSGNLVNYYDFEKSRYVSHVSLSSQKIGALQENALITMTKLQTDTERALFGILTGMQIAAIPVDPGPSGIRPPKTLIDYGISVGEVGLRIMAGGLGELFGVDVDWLTDAVGGSGSGDSTDLNDVNVAGDLNINSTFKNKYTLGADSLYNPVDSAGSTSEDNDADSDNTTDTADNI